MRGDDIDLEDMLGPDPVVPEAPKPKRKSRMGKASRALLERSQRITIRPLGKNTPERLKQLIKSAAEMPVVNSICMRANISSTTLKYWLQKSKEGKPGDGFDVVLDGEGDEPLPVRFHEAFENAIEGGLQLVEAAAFKRAVGYREVLTYQGRVIYQLDPEKVSLARELGLPDNTADCYLKDEFGAPVPETVLKQDPDLMMFIMERRMKDKYGKNAQVDVNVRGGVLVVGVRAETAEALNEMEADYRREGRPAVTFEEDD